MPLGGLMHLLAESQPVQAGDSLQHEVVISSKRRATYTSIVCLSPGRKGGVITGGMYNSRVLVNFSSMFVGRAYKLTKRSKSTLAVKLLGIRFLRRYFVVFGVRNIVLRLCGDTYNFKNLWNTLSKPLEEIFFHPLGHYLVGDLSFRLQSGPQSSPASKQSKDFFLLQYGKFAKHYEGLAPTGQFDGLWLEFCRKFLFDCAEVIGASSAASRVFWNYHFKCLRVLLPTGSLRRLSYRKTVRSVRRRIVKRIVKETQRRLWLF